MGGDSPRWDHANTGTPAVNGAFAIGFPVWHPSGMRMIWGGGYPVVFVAALLDHRLMAENPAG